MTLDLKTEYTFLNSSLLEQALTHKSYHNENSESSPGHNERLEFLGDAVLDLVLSDMLMKQFIDFSEGDLSKMRASLVNEVTLADLALEFEIDKHIKLGKGEISSGGSQKPRILASAIEAVIGAFYLDAGFEKSHLWIQELFKTRIEQLDLSQHFASDYKTRLQEVVQEKFKSPPKYQVLSAIGPDHEKIFEVQVEVIGQILGMGQGKSKKQAEQEAAKCALEKIK